jgi:hypothetical protein
MGCGQSSCAGRNLQGFGQTPRVVERCVRPGEGVETSARRRRGDPLQGDILQQLRASRIAFNSELFRGSFKRLVDGRIDVDRGVCRGVEPRGERLSARCEPRRGLPVAHGGQGASQIVMKLREVVQGVGQADQTGRYRAKVDGLERKRFEKIFDMLDRFDWRVILAGFAGEPGTDRFDGATRELQDRPPGSLERDRSSRLDNGRVETPDRRIATGAGDANDEVREGIEPRIEDDDARELEDAAGKRPAPAPRQDRRAGRPPSLPRP